MGGVIDGEEGDWLRRLGSSPEMAVEEEIGNGGPWRRKGGGIEGRKMIGTAAGRFAGDGGGGGVGDGEDGPWRRKRGGGAAIWRRRRLRRPEAAAAAAAAGQLHVGDQWARQGKAAASAAGTAAALLVWRRWRRRWRRLVPPLVLP